MILAAALAISSVLATPADVLDRIYAKRGWAFVSETNRPWRPIPNARKSDEVVLSNLARRWNLTYRPSRSTATPIAVTIDALIPTYASAGNRYRRWNPVTFRRAIVERGGVALRVRELLRNADLPDERCHWYLADRMVLARVGIDDVEKALPDLAVAIGGRYDAKTKTIDFDPRVHRVLSLQSLAERPVERTEGGNRLDLYAAALRAMSDPELTAAYASPRTITLVSVPLGDKRSPTELAKYLTAKIRTMARSNPPVNPLADADPKVAPKVWFTPVNGPAMQITRRDGSTLVF